jgi:hypothetical protein
MMKPKSSRPAVCPIVLIKTGSRKLTSFNMLGRCSYNTPVRCLPWAIKSCLFSLLPPIYHFVESLLCRMPLEAASQGSGKMGLASLMFWQGERDA